MSNYKFKKNFDLSGKYSLCVAELGDQQKKRDTIIGFFVTICGVIISVLNSFNTGALFDSYVSLGIFFILFIIGICICRIVIRYKTYKDVYWATATVINKLMNYDEETIDSQLCKNILMDKVKLNAK